ncbi:MAG: exonuclease domain-containing protein [Bdellovibrionia bacterium]
MPKTTVRFSLPWVLATQLISAQAHATLDFDTQHPPREPRIKTSEQESDHTPSDLKQSGSLAADFSRANLNESSVKELTQTNFSTPGAPIALPLDQQESSGRPRPLDGVHSGADPMIAPPGELLTTQDKSRSHGRAFMTETQKYTQLINVIDLESTCWTKEEAAGKISEIIEIGITVVDRESLQILSTESLLIRPEVSEISDFCTQLTSLTPSYVAEQGMTFSQALEILEKRYDFRSRLFASYGDYDRKMFERQFARLGIPTILGSEHLNIKRAFAQTEGLKKEVSMPGALHRLGLGLIGTHHRGGDDSRNIAQILIHLLKSTH